MACDPRRRLAAGAAALVLVAGGCGGHSAPKPGPGIGYHPTPPVVPSSAPAGVPLVVDLTNAGAVRPAHLLVASDGYLTGLRWASWGQSTARAQGSAKINLCTPSCGAGNVRTYPATVTLTGLRRCGTRDFYAAARVSLATLAGARNFGAFIHAPCAPPSTG